MLGKSAHQGKMETIIDDLARSYLRGHGRNSVEGRQQICRELSDAAAEARRDGQGKRVDKVRSYTSAIFEALPQDARNEIAAYVRMALSGDRGNLDGSEAVTPSIANNLEPDTTSVEGLHRSCLAYLSQMFTGVYTNSQNAIIIPNIDIIAIFVDLEPVGDGHIRLSVRAPLVMDLNPTNELLTYVGANAGQYKFGYLSTYMEDGQPPVTAEFEFAQIASHLSWPVLDASISIVASTACELARDIRNRFGGRFIYQS